MSDLNEVLRRQASLQPQAGQNTQGRHPPPAAQPSPTTASHADDPPAWLEVWLSAAKGLGTYAIGLKIGLAAAVLAIFAAVIGLLLDGFGAGMLWLASLASVVALAVMAAGLYRFSRIPTWSGASRLAQLGLVLLVVSAAFGLVAAMVVSSGSSDARDAAAEDRGANLWVQLTQLAMIACKASLLFSFSRLGALVRNADVRRTVRTVSILYAAGLALIVGGERALSVVSPAHLAPQLLFLIIVGVTATLVAWVIYIALTRRLRHTMHLAATTPGGRQHLEAARDGDSGEGRAAPSR